MMDALPCGRSFSALQSSLELEPLDLGAGCSMLSVSWCGRATTSPQFFSRFFCLFVFESRLSACLYTGLVFQLVRWNLEVVLLGGCLKNIEVVACKLVWFSYVLLMFEARHPQTLSL